MNTIIFMILSFITMTIALSVVLKIRGARMAEARDSDKNSISNKEEN